MTGKELYNGKPEDPALLHEWQMTQLLADIRRRERAAAWVKGCLISRKEPQWRGDWVVAAFHALLDRARQEEAPMSVEEASVLPAKVLHRRRIARRYRLAAEIYTWRRRGLTCEAIAQRLGRPISEIRREERRLLRLYQRIQGKEHGYAKPGKPPSSAEHR